MLTRTLLWRMVALSITGKPFSGTVQTALVAASAKRGFRSSYWITERMLNLLGLQARTDEDPTLVFDTAATATGGANISFALYNADQTTDPSLFHAAFCRSQMVPVSHHNKVVSGAAFSTLRAAMMEKGIRSPYWVPVNIAEGVLRVRIADDAHRVALNEAVTVVNADQTDNPQYVARVVTSTYVPVVIVAGKQLSLPESSDAVLTLKAAAVRSRFRSEFWMRKDDLSAKALHVCANSHPELIAIADDVQRQCAVTHSHLELFNLDESKTAYSVTNNNVNDSTSCAPASAAVGGVMTTMRSPPPLQPAPPELQPPEDFDQHSSGMYAANGNNSSTDASSRASTPVKQVKPTAPSSNNVVNLPSSPIVVNAGGGKTSSLLRQSERRLKRRVVLLIDEGSIASGKIDFVQTSHGNSGVGSDGSERVSLVLMGGAISVDLATLGVELEAASPVA